MYGDPVTEDLLTARDAADRIGITVDMVGYYTRTGRLEVAFAAPGRTGAKFYTVDAVDRLAAHLAKVDL